MTQTAEQKRRGEWYEALARSFEKGIAPILDAAVARADVEIAVAVRAEREVGIAARLERVNNLLAEVHRQIAEPEAEVNDLKAQRQAARMLHPPVPSYGPGYHCGSCQTLWPCETATALGWTAGTDWQVS